MLCCFLLQHNVLNFFCNGLKQHLNKHYYLLFGVKKYAKIKVQRKLTKNVKLVLFGKKIENDSIT